MNTEHQIIACLFQKPELLKTMRIGSDEIEGFVEKQIFDSLSNLVREGKVPDPVMVATAIEDETGKNMMPEIMQILDAPFVAMNSTAYEDRLIQLSRQKRQLNAAGEFYRASQSGDDDAITKLMADLRGIDEQQGVAYKSVADLMPDAIQEIDDVHRGIGMVGVKTGITKLDDITAGFQPTDMIVIAARTSVGKTAFMLNIATNLGNIPGGIVSGEQSSNQILQRMLSKEGQISASRIRSGTLDQDGFTKLVDTSIELSQRPLFIADIPRPSIDQVEQVARQMHYENDIKIFFVDYLQLIKNKGIQEKRLQIDDISKRLKALALELRIPVVCLAQLNRGAVDHQPRISDLKESGAIEEDADLIVLLSREEEFPDQLIVDVQKHRNGRTEFFRCGWAKDSMRVINREY